MSTSVLLCPIAVYAHPGHGAVRAGTADRRGCEGTRERERDCRRRRRLRPYCCSVAAAGLSVLSRDEIKQSIRSRAQKLGPVRSSPSVRPSVVNWQKQQPPPRVVKVIRTLSNISCSSDQDVSRKPEKYRKKTYLA